MEACHILLGRPWQFDKKTMHNGLTNEITFTHKEKKFALNPLPHSQVVRDQIQMKQKRDEEKRKIKIEKERTLREQKAWEKSVPSHKVIQQEGKVENTFENIPLVEQPSLPFCKGTLASLEKEEESLKKACIDKNIVDYVPSGWPGRLRARPQPSAKDSFPLFACEFLQKRGQRGALAAVCTPTLKSAS